MFPSQRNGKNLSDFLKLTRQRYLSDVQNGRGGYWTVVMGNEAGAPLPSPGICQITPLKQENKCVALIQTRRGDLNLRPENIYAFEKSAIIQRSSSLDELKDVLLCIDDEPLPGLHSEVNRFPSHLFALVDHNRLLGCFNSPDQRVVAVIDHHVDEGLYMDTANPRIVEVVGSCSSWVGKYIRDSLGDKCHELPREAATMLLCAILIDTNCLKPGDKTTVKDTEAVQYLAPLSTLGLAPCIVNPRDNPDLRALESTLSDKKSDVKNLPTGSLLKRDYKQYDWGSGTGGPSGIIRVGLSTVPMGLKEWLSPFRLQKITPNPIEEEFWDGVDSWMSERELDVLGILTTFKEKTEIGKVKRRQILLVIRGRRSGTNDVPFEATKLFEHICASLERSIVLQVTRVDMDMLFALRDECGPKEKPLGSDADIRVSLYSQGNTSASRKQIAPVMEEIVGQFRRDIL